MISHSIYSIGMNRLEGKRFKQIEDQILALRRTNQSRNVRYEIKDRNLEIMQKMMNDLYITLLEESELQEKPIGSDSV